MREGAPTNLYPELGVWPHCYGPDSALPRDRPRLVIYDTDDNIVRRFEQIRGECIEGGYVDFAVEALNMPSRYLYPILDIAPNGEQTVLIEDFSPGDDQSKYLELLKIWAEKHGVPQ